MNGLNGNKSYSLKPLFEPLEFLSCPYVTIGNKLLKQILGNAVVTFKPLDILH